MFLLLSSVEGEPCCDGGEAKVLIDQSEVLRSTLPDSSLFLLDEALEIAYCCKDTAIAISVLFLKKSMNSHLGRYSKAYNNVWQIIALAERAGLDEELAKAFIQLGLSNGYLNRREKALENFDMAQSILEQIQTESDSSVSNLVSVHRARMAMYENLNEPELAQQYLDSCRLHAKSGKISVSQDFFEIHQAYIQYAAKNFPRALEGLKKVLASGCSEDDLPLIKAKIGDIHFAMGDYAASEEASLSALELMEETKRHYDYKPLIYDRLSEIYVRTEDLKSALEMTQKSKELNFRIFDSRSENNQDLFEIRDEFTETKRRQEILQREQELIRLAQDEKILRLQRLGLIGIALSMMLVSVIVIRSQRAKRKAQIALNNELTKRISREKKYSSTIEEKNQELTLFSNIMSHDLKSPIRIVKSYSDLIKRKLEGEELDPSVLEYLDFISKSAISMSSLIDDVMVYSEVDHAGLELERTDLNDLLESILPVFQSEVAGVRPDFIIEKLPVIWANPDITKTVFRNLISNGLKYQPKGVGSHVPAIHLYAEASTDFWNVYVRDNGIGISHLHEDDLFVPFKRLHSTNEYEGTGLGLSICQRIMNQHGGEISLQGSSEEGTIFKLSFPKQRPSDLESHKDDAAPKYVSL